MTSRAIGTLLAIICLLLAAGCGDAVTDPQREGFASDPRPIEGRWVTLTRIGADEQTFEGELTPAGGVFLGAFDFFRFGRVWQLRFDDGQWDGTRLRFTAAETVNGQHSVFQWEAVLLPARDRGTPDFVPARLQLSGDPVDVAAAVEYVRPADLQAAAR